jgi:hypothetical protein
MGRHDTRSHRYARENPRKIVCRTGNENWEITANQTACGVVAEVCQRYTPKASPESSGCAEPRGRRDEAIRTTSEATYATHRGQLKMIRACCRGSGVLPISMSLISTLERVTQKYAHEQRDIEWLFFAYAHGVSMRQIETRTTTERETLDEPEF